MFTNWSDTPTLKKETKMNSLTPTETGFVLLLLLLAGAFVAMIVFFVADEIVEPWLKKKEESGWVLPEWMK